MDYEEEEESRISPEDFVVKLNKLFAKNTKIFKKPKKNGQIGTIFDVELYMK